MADPTLRETLERYARQPALRTRLGNVPVHGRRLSEILSTLPPSYEAALSDDGAAVVLSWGTPSRRGRLTLRALGRPEAGPYLIEALAEAKIIASSGKVGWWRVRFLKDELKAAVKRAFGADARLWDAPTLVAQIEQYMWRNY